MAGLRGPRPRHPLPRIPEALHAHNRRVAALADDADARLVPLHDHFLGHGLTEPDPDERWYWRHNPIEPSARGASEVRRLWLEALTPAEKSA